MRLGWQNYRFIMINCQDEYLWNLNKNKWHKNTKVC